MNAVKQRAIYRVYTDRCSHQASPVALPVEQTLHAIRVPRMCGTNTYLLVLYNAINWLLPHSSKTLPDGVIPQTLSCGARRVWGPDYILSMVMLGWSCSCLSHTVVSFHEKIRKSAAHEREVHHLRRVTGPSSGSSCQIMLHIYLYTCLKPLLNCQCCRLWLLLVHLRKHFLDLGLAACN